MWFTWTTITWLVVGLVLITWVADLGLEWINRRHVRARAGEVPGYCRGYIDREVYGRAIAYTLARSQFHNRVATVDLVVLLGVLWSGVLPWSWQWLLGRNGSSVWGTALFLAGWGFVLSLPSWPMDWHAQFKLEARFGFNTTTRRTWWTDRLKGLVLAFVLGYPLLVMILKGVEWMAGLWWLWAWGAVAIFQIVMVVVAPILILPLFNRFTRLPEGCVRTRLIGLAERTGFRARDIQMMDGSRRSTHTNAFFTGIGRWRRIVLFDTLVQQLSEEEVEAVLAHEIGHYQRRHVPGMMGMMLAGLFLGFYLLGWLARQEAFLEGFGFGFPNTPAALMVFALVSGSCLFWLSPIFNVVSRTYEYQADRFALAAMGRAEPLVTALRKLCTSNLSNLVPHPIYSRFHYSHPTLAEREAALLVASAAGLPPAKGG